MMRKLDCDVLIIGAGQAGLAAAWPLAQSGKDVLLVSRPPGGVGKACAGGLTNKALARYPFSVEDVIRTRVSTLSISRAFSRQQDIAVDVPLVHMTVRRELDDYCCQKALAAGARLQPVSGPVTAVIQSPDKVQVCWQDLMVSADYVVAADGSSSSVRKRLYGQALPAGFALEVEIPSAQLSDNMLTRFDFGCPGSGYGWAFPKSDHWNLGVYTFRPYAGNMRQVLQGYLDGLGISLQQRDLSVRGAPIASRQVGPAGQGRVLFAGDALGSAEALFGEGIYGALVSGQMAAEVIAGDYGAGSALHFDNILRPLRRTNRYVSVLANAFYATMPLVYPLFSRHFRKLCQAESSLPPPHLRGRHGHAD